MQAFMILSVALPPLLAFLLDLKSRQVLLPLQFVVRLFALLAFNIFVSLVLEDALAGMEIIAMNYILSFATTTLLYVFMLGRIRSTRLRPIWAFYLLTLGLSAGTVFLFIEVPLAGLGFGLAVLLLYCVYPVRKPDMQTET